MSRPTDDSRYAEVEEWVVETFGQRIRPRLEAELADPISVAVVDVANVLRKSSAFNLIAGWRQADRKSNAGRKPLMTAENALALILLQMRLSAPTHITAMSQTFLRLSPAQRKVLGLTHDGKHIHSYDRIWRAIRSLITLVDEFPGPRKRIPTEAQYRAIVAARDPEDQRMRRERMFTLANDLLEGTRLMQPKELRDRSDGNVAIDATAIAMLGKAGNPAASNLNGKRWSMNFDAGFYRREGNHDAITPADAATFNRSNPGQKAKGTSFGKRAWSVEGELSRLTPNLDQSRGDFPLLTVAVSFHIPGAVKGEGLRLVESLKQRGHKINLVIGDRAYSNGVYDEFAVPIRLLGGKHVFDYKETELGVQSHDPRGFVQIAGSWYLDTIPQVLRDADKVIVSKRNSWDKFRLAHLRNNTPDPGGAREKAFKERKKSMEQAEALYASQHSKRSKSRLKPKGVIGDDWTRRYLIPTDSPDYERWKAQTGAHQGVTVTMLRPVDVPPTEANPGGLKREQYFEYQSAAWIKAYGMRNGVESANRSIKRSQTEDIANADKRAVRGNTFTYIVATAAVVVENLRRIISHYKEHLAIKTTTAKTTHLAVTYWESPQIALDDIPLTG